MLSLVEYALLVALIALVCIAAVTFFGSQTSETFIRVGDSIARRRDPLRPPLRHDPCRESAARRRANAHRRQAKDASGWPSERPNHGVDAVDIEHVASSQPMIERDDESSMTDVGNMSKRSSTKTSPEEPSSTSSRFPVNTWAASRPLTAGLDCTSNQASARAG